MFKASPCYVALSLVIGCGGGDATGGHDAAADRRIPMDAGSPRPDGQRPDGGTRCDAPGAACPDGEACQPSTGRCIARNCSTDGCPPGRFCDPDTGTCMEPPRGTDVRYETETLVGHGVQSRLTSFDGVGLPTTIPGGTPTVSRDGRYVYLLTQGQLLRLDVATRRLEAFSGTGWPGYRDGPAELARFEFDFYQAGGVGISPDGRFLYFTANGRIRRVELATGEMSTLWPSELADAGFRLRSLAVGPDSGKLYLLGWGGAYVVYDPADDTVERRPLDPSAWASSQLPGYMAVDERRGWVYGLERNRQSGAFYRWPLAGGSTEWLNHRATGERNRQNTSDGPVADAQFANPIGLTVDRDGFVYIGAGDGRSVRRYDPESETILSLCRTEDADPRDPRTFEWCVSDGERNKVFGTWPGFFPHDGGNAFLFYSVWPRVIRLRRVR